MKVLLFGGSFDPPHRGHKALLEAGIALLAPARTLVLPTYLSPYKESHGAPGRDRLEMARLLAKGLPGASADAFELKRARRTYSYELVREARRRFPKAEIWYLVGSDSLATLGGWKRADELRRTAKWLVGERPGARAAKPAGFDVKRLPGRFPDVSSTELRAALYCGEEWRDRVPKRVARYVKKRRLYGLAHRDVLADTLSKDRYAHTLGVSKLAAELARIHGHDASAAALAGLLHDCGRRFDLAGMARYANARRLPVPERAATLSAAPLLAHAYIGADLAKREFGVKDPEVLGAIAHHTLGKPGMSAFERLLYIADIASADRGFPAAGRIRRLAKKDLDLAFLEAVRTKEHWVRETGEWLHPITPRVRRVAEKLCPR
ncbi:MAG: nicotinate (nicotinamide) nucleotide adenylyltransferase [Elusimicrobia bacterium]|nr:nicotinate (nicotinamide) nucleotide adenylyltransferase [Elusimicrobiota bacterium]